MVSEDIQRKADKAASVAAKADPPAHEASQLLQGKIPSDDSKSLGHPIHPATVHWPIAVSPPLFYLSLKPAPAGHIMKMIANSKLVHQLNHYLTTSYSDSPSLPHHFTTRRFTLVRMTADLDPSSYPPPSPQQP